MDFPNFGSNHVPSESSEDNPVKTYQEVSQAEKTVHTLLERRTM